MNIAYVRVSTEEQNEARQIEALKKYNIDKWFTEKVSGKNTKRPQLQAMIEFAREGDKIYVHDFSRLARSTKDLLGLIEQFQEKRVHLISNKENFDTSTATGKLMITMIAAINEFERNNLLERQREGIAIAKRNGVYKGRKKIPLPDNWKEVYDQYMTRQINATEAMDKLGIKKNTFYRMKNAYSKKLSNRC